MRLIDADELYETRHEICNRGGNYIEVIEPDEVMSARTIDAVEVVKCKDCKYHFYDSGYNQWWCNYEIGCRNVHADDFCSRGDRKGDDTD